MDQQDRRRVGGGRRLPGSLLDRPAHAGNPEHDEEQDGDHGRQGQVEPQGRLPLFLTHQAREVLLRPARRLSQRGHVFGQARGHLGVGSSLRLTRQGRGQ